MPGTAPPRAGKPWPAGNRARRRLGIETDPRYINRRHGPDELGRDTRQNNRLTESEAKGSKSDRVQVAKDTDEEFICDNAVALAILAQHRKRWPGLQDEMLPGGLMLK